MHDTNDEAAGGTRPAEEGAERDRRARHAGRDRRRAARAGLLALLGIALGVGTVTAATAAWTDQVWISDSIATGTADLEGSLDGTTWKDSSDAGAIELVLPAIADLRPGDTQTYEVQVRNTGTLAADLTSTVTTSGALFGGTAPVDAVLSGLPATLAGGGSDTGTLTITAPAWTGSTHQGETGTVTVTITGTVP